MRALKASRSQQWTSDEEATAKTLRPKLHLCCLILLLIRQGLRRRFPKVEGRFGRQQDTQLLPIYLNVPKLPCAQHARIRTHHLLKKKKNLSLLLHASFQIVRCHPSGLWPSSGSWFYPTFACHLRSTGMYCQFCLPMCSLSPPPLYPQGPRGLSQSPSFTSIRCMDTRYLQIWTSRWGVPTHWQQAAE